MRPTGEQLFFSDLDADGVVLQSLGFDIKWPKLNSSI
jgi:hypothetical protein